jgi:aminoglycoside N3'-acetyltransferase
MYDLGGKVVFMGCGMSANTYHHFVEAVFAEEILSLVKEEDSYLLKNLVTFDTRDEHTRQLKEESSGGKKHSLIRFQFGKRRQRNRTLESGIAKEADCGSSHFILFNIKDYVDGLLYEVRTYTDEFYTNDVLNLIETIKNKYGESTNE